jgi:hypothetical protein
MKNKSNRSSLFLIINIVFVLILTGIAVYHPSNTASSKGLLSYPEWAAPLVFMVVSLLFAGHSFRTGKHTLVNVGVMVLSGIILLIPVPGTLGTSIKWWYPLVAGLVVNIFIPLDESAD